MMGIYCFQANVTSNSIAKKNLIHNTNEVTVKTTGSVMATTVTMTSSRQNFGSNVQTVFRAATPVTSGNSDGMSSQIG